MRWEQARDRFLAATEKVETCFGYALIGTAWRDRLYSPTYWAVREATVAPARESPMRHAELDRLTSWLNELTAEAKRIAEQDEWDDSGRPRLLLDTSALLRQRDAFDGFNWAEFAECTNVRLIIPILVVRELDDLKNSRREPSARTRLKRIYEILEGKVRGPADVRPNTTLEVVMDPRRHERHVNHDAEIIERALYLKGRKGGPLTLVTGDYTMILSARALELTAKLTPQELMLTDDGMEQ